MDPATARQIADVVGGHPRLSVTKRVDESTVGRRARTGAVWSLVQIVARNLLNVATTAALARLLTPDDYGVIGMVATLTSLLVVFADMGLSWATVQRRELTHVQLSNLFWVNAAAGALLWGVCVAVAQPVARFYGRGELRVVAIALGVSFLFGGVAVQPLALMQRQMRFHLITKIEVAAALISAACAVLLAFLGAGYWALVIQAIVTQFVRALLGLLRSGLVLQAPRRDAATKEMVRFGGLLALNGVLIYVARNLDSVLIGRHWGTEQLGYYNRAYFLMLLPSMLATGVLTNVMVPTLSALQGESERLGHAYRRAVRLVAFVGVPIAAGLALVAPEVVRIVYGERWAPVAPMVLWLSIACVTQPVYNTAGWLFTAAGKGKSYLWVTACNALVLGCAFCWAVERSPVAVAQAYGLTMGVALLWPSLWLAHIAAGIQLWETFTAVLPVYVAVALMSVGVVLLGSACRLVGADAGLRLGIQIAGGVGIYACAVLGLMRTMMREDVAPMVAALKRRVF